MLDSAWSFILAWYNLPFSFLLGLCVVLAVSQAIGLGGDHEGDANADTDADADTDVDHDVDVDHDADLDHDAALDHDLDHDVDHDLDHTADHDVDHHLDHEAHADSVGALSVLAFIGLGKAPLLVVLLILFGAIGILGWIMNYAVQRVFGAYPGIAFAAVLPLALIAGSLVSSRTARLIGRALPPISTTATRAQALVGKRGAVISPFVDEKYGQVHVRDSGGTLISVFAVTEAEAPIGRGSDVVLVSYNPEKKLYTVTRP